MHVNITHTGNQLSVTSLKFDDWNPRKLTVPFLRRMEKQCHSVPSSVIGLLSKQAVETRITGQLSYTNISIVTRAL